LVAPIAWSSKRSPEPEPRAVHVVIQVKAFGINHAEVHMRRGEWAKAAPVSGIECVGLVKSCPGGEFHVDRGLDPGKMLERGDNVARPRN
jgi:NADPH:quinone reductase-like Zn-dependent oxidoreductase